MNKLHALLLVLVMLIACDSGSPTPVAPDDGITVSDPSEQPTGTEPIKDESSEPEPATPNNPPSVHISKTLLEPAGTRFSFVASAFDPDGDPLSYT